MILLVDEMSDSKEKLGNVEGELGDLGCEQGDSEGVICHSKDELRDPLGEMGGK
jgi:hypothetical protein